MNFEEVIRNGKDKLRAAGVVELEVSDEQGNLTSHLPGLGWSGSGLSYSRNREALARYCIQTRLIGDNFSPDASISLFGENLSAPILASPMSGIKTNLREQIDEKIFLDAVLGGCVDAGTLGACGDSFDTTERYIGATVISENKGIAVLKPRSLKEIEERIHMLIDSHVTAIGLDLDGMTGLLLGTGKVSRKNKQDLKQIRALFSGPMFLKGILSVEDASAAYESGFDGIAISNHGGRSIDYCPAPANVLPSIAREFRGKLKIFADGGIKNGYDIFIYLALGADAVLVGRTVLYAAIGGGRAGVATVISRLNSDLSRAMVLTGCKNIGEIGPESIRLYE
jgi:4-hydroxymandelate oxidase